MGAKRSRPVVFNPGSVLSRTRRQARPAPCESGPIGVLVIHYTIRMKPTRTGAKRSCPVVSKPSPRECELEGKQGPRLVRESRCECTRKLRRSDTSLAADLSDHRRFLCHWCISCLGPFFFFWLPT